MRKLFWSLFMLFGLALTSQAQGTLRKGDTQLNAGLGLSGWGTPVYVGLDFGVGKNFTLGVEGSYRSYDQNYYGGKFSSSIIGLQGNGNYHFNDILDMDDEWDLYAGLSLNYYIWQTDTAYKEYARASGLGLGAQVGARYFFTKKFGLNLELGGGNATSGGKFGITYKF